MFGRINSLKEISESGAAPASASASADAVAVSTVGVDGDDGGDGQARDQAIDSRVSGPLDVGEIFLCQSGTVVLSNLADYLRHYIDETHFTVEAFYRGDRECFSYKPFSEQLSNSGADVNPVNTHKAQSTWLTEMRDNAFQCEAQITADAQRYMRKIRALKAAFRASSLMAGETRIQYQHEWDIMFNAIVQYRETRTNPDQTLPAFGERALEAGVRAITLLRTELGLDSFGLAEKRSELSDLSSESEEDPDDLGFSPLTQFLEFG